MSLREKRERFKCQQKSSGYCSFENLAGGDEDVRDIEIQNEKEDLAILSTCSEGKDIRVDTCDTCEGLRLSPNKVDGSETAVGKCVDVGLSIDLYDSKCEDGASTALRTSKDSSETDEGKGTAVDNSSRLGLSSDLIMPKAETKTDNALDKYESFVYKVQDDIVGEKEHIKTKPSCESEGIEPSGDTNDSVELGSFRKSTDAIVTNDGINSDRGASSKLSGLNMNLSASESSLEDNAVIRTQSVSSNDEYRVLQTKLKETEVVPSHNPQLCTTPTADYHHNVFAVFTQSKEDCDGQRSSISSSASSLASKMSDYKIMKRHSAVVKIDDDTNFFRVQTVKYLHHKTKSKQHYVKELHEKDKEIEGDIGLRPGDLLLEAQGKSLTDRSQKDILRIFKKIKPNKNGRIRIQLVFRRWETREEDGMTSTYEVDYELKIVLAPDTHDLTPETDRRKLPKVFQKHRGRLQKQFTFKVAELSQKETAETELPKGQIDYITSRGHDDHRIQSVNFGGEFITADHDGLPSLKVWDGVSASENVFTFTYFSGMDRSQEPLTAYIYCARISCPGPRGVRYLTSHLHSHNELMFQTSPTQKVTVPDDVDETCFILREIGREVLFESLLHRGFYVACKNGAQGGPVSFVMTEKSKHDVINEDNLDDVTFKQWPVKEEQGSGIFTQVTQVFHSLFSCAAARNRSNFVTKR